MMFIFEEIGIPLLVGVVVYGLLRIIGVLSYYKD
jgi:hypothetical protein